VDPSAGLDDVVKRKLLTLPGLELRSLRRRCRSQSLYRLSYPVLIGSMLHEIKNMTMDRKSWPTCIREVIGSNLGLYTVYNGQDSYRSFRHSCKFWDGTSNLGHVNATSLFTIILSFDTIQAEIQTINN
jgi:hypothetical protein